MDYWSEYEQGPVWRGENIELFASVEPSGIQIYGNMPSEIWNRWFGELKMKLTQALGYEIGEPEDGYRGFSKILEQTSSLNIFDKNAKKLSEYLQI